MELNSFLKDSFAHPFRWVEDCYNQVNKSIGKNSNTKDCLRTMNVVVYGPSQVGKTTLILRLLGIREDCDINEILRADRPKGYSSTPVAILYSRSFEEKFILSPDPKFPKDKERIIEIPINQKNPEVLKKQEEKVKQFIKDWRANIESANSDFYPELCVQIGLPNSYFKENIESENVLYNLIDIPGINSSEKKEIPYIKNVCNNYIPSVAGIVCASRVDDLQTLCPSSIDNWDLELQKYLFVSTYTFSCGTFHDYFEKANQYHQLQERVFNQIFDNYGDDKKGWGRVSFFKEDARNKFFPIELGQSFSQMNKDDKKKAQIFQDEAVKRIKEKLNETVTSFSRLKEVFSYPARYKERYDREVESIEKKTIWWKAKIKKTEKRIDYLKKKWDDANQVPLCKLEHLQRDFAYYCKCCSENENDPIEDAYQFRSEERDNFINFVVQINLDINESEIQKCITNVNGYRLKEILRNRLEYLQKNKNKWIELRPTLCKRIESLMDVLPSEAIPGGFGNSLFLDSKRRALRNWIKKTVKKLLEEIKKEYNGLVVDIEKEDKKYIRSLNGYIAYLQSLLNKIEKELLEQQNSLQEIESDLKLKKEQRDILPEIPKLYKDKLWNARNDEINKLNALMKSTSSGKKKFLCFMAMNQVIFVYHQMIES